ncbi:Fmp27, c-terminal [Globisporangium polare]
METSPLFHRRKVSSASVSSLGTNMTMSGSGNTHADVEQHTDELQRLTREYESISEVLRNLVQLEQKKLQPLPNVEMDFHLQSASLTLSGANMDIVRVSMSSLRFKMKQFEDQSGSFTLTLQDLSAQNLCPGTPYPDLLQSSSTSNTWGGGNAFLRVDAEIAAPVGGITVVKHFEVNVHPIQVCITQEVILHLVAFFTSSGASSSTQEEKRDEVRSKFLQARPVGSSSDGRVGSALKKAVKVAGKAANPLGLGKTHRDDDRDANRRARSFTTIQEEASAWVSKATANHANETQLLLGSEDDLPHGTDQANDAAAEREISEMKERAKTNILFKRIRIGTVEVVVTYKNKKSHHHNHQPLEDMRGFEVKVHALVYCDKTCSMMDLLLRIRRDVILDVLSQVGRNFTNIANFLRDQVDLTRWGQFDALAPLKTLSTTVTSLANTASQSSSVVPASSIPTVKPVEVTARIRASTTPTSSQDSAQKFQLELPETHRSLRKKHTASNLRPVEAVHRGVPNSNPSPAPSPRKVENPDQPAESDGYHHHRSTAGKAKSAFVHLFTKKKSGNSSPSKPDDRPRAATAAAASDENASKSQQADATASKA